MSCICINTKLVIRTEPKTIRFDLSKKVDNILKSNSVIKRNYFFFRKKQYKFIVVQI